MNLLAQPSLGADAEAVADDEHANHQFRIDRGPAGVAVERRQMLAQIPEIEKTINAAKNMVRRNVSVEIEGVEELL